MSASTSTKLERSVAAVAANVLAFLLILGCDRLLTGTVNNARLLEQRTPCGHLQLSVERFVERHYYLQFSNRSSNTLHFHPLRLVARQGGQPLEYRLFRDGATFQTEILALRPGESFTYDIVSPEGEVIVQGPELFSADGTLCGVGPLLLRVP